MKYEPCYIIVSRGNHSIYLIDSIENRWNKDDKPELLTKEEAKLSLERAKKLFPKAIMVECLDYLEDSYQKIIDDLESNDIYLTYQNKG